MEISQIGSQILKFRKAAKLTQELMRFLGMIAVRYKTWKTQARKKYFYSLYTVAGN